MSINQWIHKINIKILGIQISFIFNTTRNLKKEGEREREKEREKERERETKRDKERERETERVRKVFF